MNGLADSRPQTVSGGKTLIKMEGVCKKYCRNLRRSMLYGMQDIATDVFNRSVNSSRLREYEFWSLHDISLDVQRGEVLGVLGANGAGKSTLLKLISGIIYPDAGSVRTRGKVGELIEVNAGFHPMLTGRENIYVKGAILGLSRREIDRVFDDIVSFAELEDFIDTPVKYYSSGMHMRLGFAVIAHSRPDILLIDEVLSVGDVSFRAKCFNKITEIITGAGAVFVSHNMGDVSRICSKIMVLRKGECIYYGQNVTEGIDCYYQECAVGNEPSVAGSGRAIIERVFIEGAENSGPVTEHAQGKEMVLNLTARVDADVPVFETVVSITNLEQQHIIQYQSHFDDICISNRQDCVHLRINLGEMHLNTGIYAVTVGIHRENRGETLVRCGNCLTFRITGSRIGHSPLQIPAGWESVN